MEPRYRGHREDPPPYTPRSTYEQGAVVSQPGAYPSPRHELRDLAELDQVLIQQAVELTEVFIGIECANQYKIKDIQGRDIFYAAEESSFLSRQCCRSRRGFAIHVRDHTGQELIGARRRFKCCGGCCMCCAWMDCCAHTMEIQAPPGESIGHIQQMCSICSPSYEVQAADQSSVMQIRGPCMICEIPCTSIKFKVLDGDKEVGKINKQWSGFLKEVFSEADNFALTFPMELDLRSKATLLAAVFLIDMVHFENRKKVGSPLSWIFGS